ncbi:MAG: DEAD/DEAH box helicase [Bacteroidota bacterium]
MEWRPTPKFERYELHERVLAQLPALGYRRPTEVQHKVIPLFIQKRNLIVEAPTGTGKTAAYGLPLISRLNLLKRSTQALILLPSRELAIQVTEALRSFFKGEQLQVESVIGGVSMEESHSAIRKNPHILVAIPARLRDVLAHHPYDYLWRDIRFLIVDEGDKLLEMNFQRDFDEVIGKLSSKIQVGFFSATISPDAEAMMRERFRRLTTIRLSPRDMLRNIRFWQAKAKGKREPFLVVLLQQQRISQALIFCRRREDVFGITSLLRNCGWQAESYYGNQEQQERQNILTRFQEGHIQYLVASDLAARGLDIEALPAVINLAIPEMFDYYLHRVGRTGRAGNKGEVYNLVASDREEAYLQRHHHQIGLGLKKLEIEAAPLKSQRAELDARWNKYLLSRGKRDKVRKGDVVGFLTQAGGIDGQAIGTITIYETYTTVDLRQGDFQQLEDSDTPLKLKGKSVNIRPYKMKEQAEKAKQVRKLKIDRTKRDQEKG